MNVTKASTVESTLCWSTGKAKNTHVWDAVQSQTWADFVQWLDPASPADAKEVSPYVGGTLQRGRRSRSTVEQRFFLTLDVDHADPDFPLEVGMLLNSTPYVIHTTWRHLEDGVNHRYRLIIPLDRGVTPNEHKEIAWAMMSALGGDQFDKTTAQAERFMWGPSTADPSTYFHVVANTGAAYLPVDAWLAARGGRHNAPTGTAGATGTPTPAGAVSGPHSASEEDKERAAEILAGAVADVEQVYERGDFSGRNEAVFHLMPLLLQFAEAGALDEDEVLTALWDAAQSVPAEEPYTRSEFEVSVGSAKKYVAENGPVLPETTPTKLALEDFEGIVLDDLWTKTDRLKHVAQAADSMGRNRLALLSTLLIRVLGEVPPGICLPGVEDGAVGSRAALNLGVALVGSSGQGKSAFFDESQNLFGRDQTELRGDPSTGQGLIQSYIQWDSALEKNVLVADPRRIFVVDEVDKLGALGSDSGSTLLGEVRTMLTGGSTGSSNATKERQRMLHARTYNFQLIVGVQPARADPLLSGRDAGTPQRFIWTTVTDPNTALHPSKRPEWPGPIGWDDSFLLDFEFGLAEYVDYPDWVKAELLDYDYKVSLEGPEGGEMSRFGHQNLLRLKVAAGIAFLHESSSIQDLHIEIADLIIEASRRVQVKCERAVAEATFMRKKTAMSSDERAREEIGNDKLSRLIHNAKKALLRAHGEWVWYKDFRPAYRDRDQWEEALWEALESDEDVETHTEERGARTRRKARMA